ncbi:hypothetical protein G4Y79_08580 [Phototrophicus methaneseepsis]|uniref:Uncharacterized protein n=1 Tax=Phototrophicus methaneseepsis TaxID=2710758 RepID=A0A7S8ECI7_9CHLR|nr:hypothetical protein [Phototrophicus methaneseepsis]QPC84414.1 hypothetical protein G4Y79_08580 [Phototrophicus methaneseepsis]
MNSLIELVQAFLLGDGVIFLGLMILFFGLSYWALVALQERTGYVVGWMVGLLFILVYSSLNGFGGAIDPDTAPPMVTLNFFQVALPGVCGLVLGIGSVALLRLSGGGSARLQDFFRIAFFTALSVILIFLMIVSGPGTRRMIGIFSLGFAITAIITIVVFRRLIENPNSSFGSRFGAPYNDPFTGQGVPMPEEDPLADQNAPNSRLESIREGFKTSSNVEGRIKRDRRRF